MFSSEDEAAVAAVTAYRGYLDVSTSISSDGGRHAARILDVAGKGEANKLLAEFEAMRADDQTTTGAPELIAVNLIEFDAGLSKIELRVCLGAGDRRLLDAAGADVTPDRLEREPLVVTLKAFAPDRLLVTASERPAGATSC